MKKIAVVLLNYNGLALLKTFLPSVVENSVEADLFLIDNGSTDTSLEWVNTHYPEVECIALPENLGYAGGYNEGLCHIKNPLFCLLNTDVRVPPNWLTPLSQHFDSNTTTAIAQPHILNYRAPQFFEYAGAAGGYIDAFGIPFCRGRIFNQCEEDKGQYDNEQDIFWASGACFFIRRPIFWDLGGFDTRFFAHQEEIDLCWRAINAGYKIKAIGHSKVYHLGGGTLNPSPQKVYLNHRNSLWMLLKNLPHHKRLKILLCRLFLDGIAGILYLIQFKFRSFFAIIKAHYSFYKYCISFNPTDSKSFKNEGYYYTNNLIWEYFVLRRLNFDSISKIKNKIC